MMRSIRATLSASWSRSPRSDPDSGSCATSGPARAGRCRVVGDEHSAALVGLHELFLAQDVERVADGHRRDTVAAGQFPARWQAFPRLERPAGDARPQVVGHLQVRRARIVRLWLHPSSVRRPSCLGRTAGLTEGLCPHANCSRLFYIDLVQSSSETRMALQGQIPVEFGECSPTARTRPGGSRWCGTSTGPAGTGWSSRSTSHRAAAVGGRGDRRAGGRPAADGQGEDRRAGSAGAAVPGAGVAVYRGGVRRHDRHPVRGQLPLLGRRQAQVRRPAGVLVQGHRGAGSRRGGSAARPEHKDAA